MLKQHKSNTCRKKATALWKFATPQASKARPTMNIMNIMKGSSRKRLGATPGCGAQVLLNTGCSQSAAVLIPSWTELLIKQHLSFGATASKPQTRQCAGSTRRDGKLRGKCWYLAVRGSANSSLPTPTTSTTSISSYLLTVLEHRVTWWKRRALNTLSLPKTIAHVWCPPVVVPR